MLPFTSKSKDIFVCMILVLLCNKFVLKITQRNWWKETGWLHKLLLMEKHTATIIIIIIIISVYKKKKKKSCILNTDFICISRTFSKIFYDLKTIWKLLDRNIVNKTIYPEEFPHFTNNNKYYCLFLARP